MVRVEINLKSTPAWIKVTGHCGNHFQHKIVCSAVSTLVQSLYLGLKKVLKLPVRGIIKSGKFIVILPEIGENKKREVQFALEVFILSVKSIAKIYKYVKLVEVRG